MEKVNFENYGASTLVLITLIGPLLITIPLGMTIYVVFFFDPGILFFIFFLLSTMPSMLFFAYYERYRIIQRIEVDQEIRIHYGVWENKDRYSLKDIDLIIYHHDKHRLRISGRKLNGYYRFKNISIKDKYVVYENERNIISK